MAPRPTGAKGKGLTRKVGPLPLWAWGAIAVAGILAGIYLRRRFANTGSTSATPSSASVPDTTGLTGAGAGTGSGGGTSSDTGGGMSPVAPYLPPVIFLGGGAPSGATTTPVAPAPLVVAPTVRVVVPTIGRSGAAAGSHLSASSMTAQAPPPGVSVASLAAAGQTITPQTTVTAPNPGAGTRDVSSGIAGLGGASGGTYRPAAVVTAKSSPAPKMTAPPAKSRTTERQF